ncbi:MAG: alpha/beta hydrolase [Alteromonadaceae bacterium]|nr:alpha/beta hydrolase [Alteromonadaceae bacterium]
MIVRILNIVAVFAFLSGVTGLSHASQGTTRTHTLEEMRIKYAGPASQFVDIEGINVHYRDEGEGPVVLLMHGTLGDLSDWDEWTQVLKKHFRVVRFDLPGFGLTADIANGNYSVSRSHVLIDGLMDHLGAESFAVVGISYGGMVMFRYAATRTERVTAMVLINSAGIQRGKRAKPANDAKLDKRSKAKTNIFIDPVVMREDVEAFYQSYINDPDRRSPELIQRKLDLLNIKGRDKLSVAAYKLYEAGHPQRVLSHVKAPSLIMWGTDNQALDTETANAFMDAMTSACNKKLVTFDNGGHYINVERPYETAEATKQFLMNLTSNPPKGCQKLED